MALCGRLEQQTRDQIEAHETLVDTLLDALTRSTDADELAANWARIADNFDTLFTAESSIDRLEETIVHLGVTGCLVKQFSDGQDASEILEKIAAEKERLFRLGSIKRPKIKPAVTDAEKPFQAPPGWAWERLENICEIIVDCPHSTPRFTNEGYLCLDTNSFKNGELVPDRLRYVDVDTFNKRVERLKPRPGDIVFAREGTVGEAIVVPDDVQCCLGQRVMLFRPTKFVNEQFLRYVITSPMAIEQLTSIYKGIGAKHVNVGDMRNYVIAIPPEDEQQRIVEQIEKLSAYCDRLRAHMRQAEYQQHQLADATVEAVVGIPGTGMNSESE
jgi:type I restriction enzyme S subunit